MGKNSKTIQSRTWTFVGYPESIADNWEELLVGCPFVRSPLHDSDLNADETQKKAHWHFLVSFPNQKTFNQMQELTQALKCTIPQQVRDTRAMCRYFLHLDNPEKAQYKREDLLVRGGFDIESALKLSKSEEDSEERNFVSRILNAINEFDIVEFEDLLNYLMTNCPEDYKLFKANAFVFANVVKSRRNRSRSETTNQPPHPKP